MVNSTKILPSEVQFLFGREREKQIYNMSENEGKKEKWNENGVSFPPHQNSAHPHVTTLPFSLFRSSSSYVVWFFSSEILQLWIMPKPLPFVNYFTVLGLFHPDCKPLEGSARPTLDSYSGLRAAQAKQLRDTCWPLWQHCHFRIGTTFLKLPFPKTLE